MTDSKDPLHAAAFGIATGCYSGLAPTAPGTVGSAVAIPLWLLLWYAGLWNPLYCRIAAIFTVILIGLWACSAVMKRVDDSDPQFIVIDEWAGMLITLSVISTPTFLSAALAFLWFRVFDIWKPGPVSWAEGKPGAWGVMLDDCLAGVMAAIMVWLSQMGLGNI